MTPEQQAQNWLGSLGVSPIALTKVSGYCNHVFLVEQASTTYPAKSVLRLANRSLGVGLCPLADHSELAIGKYCDAEGLGLAPPLILADAAAGVMWLAHAGEPVSLGRSSFNSIRTMLERLHSSGFEWGGSSETEDAEKTLLALRQRFTAYSHESSLSPRSMKGANFHSNQDAALPDAIDCLLSLGHQYGYFTRPKVPAHSDLNPGNWLYDGERWWLVDWDYAGMYPLEWDYAGLIVEHGWDEVLAGELLPEFSLCDVAWFCSLNALLSWDWHIQRGSNFQAGQEKRRQFEYWFRRIGDR